jgi:hypothetical protein
MGDINFSQIFFIATLLCALLHVQTTVVLTGDTSFGKRMHYHEPSVNRRVTCATQATDIAATYIWGWAVGRREGVSAGKRTIH